MINEGGGIGDIFRSINTKITKIVQFYLALKGIIQIQLGHAKDR